jgi:hypothetical protein
MIDQATLQHFLLGMMMALSYPTFKRFKYPYLVLILLHPFIIGGFSFSCRIEHRIQAMCWWDWWGRF